MSFLEIKTGISLPTITFEDVLKRHKEFSRSVLESVNHLQLDAVSTSRLLSTFLEKRNYSENLLKNVNMMLGRLDLHRNIDPSSAQAPQATLFNC